MKRKRQTWSGVDLTFRPWRSALDYPIDVEKALRDALAWALKESKLYMENDRISGGKNKIGNSVDLILHVNEVVRSVSQSDSIYCSDCDTSFDRTTDDDADVEVWLNHIREKHPKLLQMGALSPILRSLKGGSIAFWCPGCDGAHVVSPDIWKWDGNVNAPTVTPSILIRTGHYIDGKHPCWCDYNRGLKKAPFECSVCHSFVEQGQIRFLGDCTHDLAGQTVPIPPWPHSNP